MIVMQYIWNESKRESNLRKHGLDFRDAKQVFAGPTFTFEDVRMAYGEHRWVSLGLLGNTVVVMVHTETNDETRIISMRKATHNEQVLFFTNL